ncbi:MAG TPA: ABC transporter substrate-binding protein [Pirellulales bacterium]|nr:ABC transporter substrate-binding protein [Pirellulales bacterium]
MKGSLLFRALSAAFNTRFVARLACGLLAGWIGLSVVLVAPLPAPVMAAQKSKLDEEEEEPPPKDAPKPAQKSKLDEEEEEPPPKDAPKPAQKSKLDEEEEEPPAKGAERPKPSSGRSRLDEEEEPGDKGKPTSPRAGKQADDDPAEDEASLAYDTVFIKKGTSVKRWKITLVPQWIEPPWPPPKEFTFRIMLTNSTKRETFKAEDVQAIAFFENRVIDEVAESLGTKGERLCRPADAFDLSQPDVRAEQPKALRQLARALEEHDSAVQRNLRRGPGWETKLRQRLLDAMFNLRLGKVDVLLSQGAFAEAVAECDRLRSDIPSADEVRDQALRSRLQKALLDPAEKAAEAKDFEAARRLLGDLTGRFPGQRLGGASEFAQRLKTEAGDLLKEALELAKRDPPRAQELLEEAAGIWPDLNGLDDARQKLGRDYPILECAYPELPRQFSPLGARTPIEQHAVSLLFERLVRWSADGPSGGHYAPQLAEGRPVPLAKGRQFQLPRYPLCRWSDYTDDAPYICMAADVDFTVRLMHKWPSAGAGPAWDSLVGAVDRHSNSFLADIRLKQDYWQPLSLMDFYVLPRHRFPQGGTEDELSKFSREPVGTGPYTLAELQEEFVQFKANPHYRQTGRPKIREIRFHRLDPLPALDAFRSDKIQLVYALSTDHVNQLNLERRKVLPIKTPSVWFLAPNYRRSHLHNQNLRLAIAHSIERKEILDQFFRPGRDATDHAELTGPFPAHSWAYNREVPPFSAEKAKAFADDARKELQSIPKLNLVYPPNQSDVENACKQIADKLQTIGIELALVPAAPGEFYNRVLYDSDFDLAYWRHDFRDETYWLGSLFDPHDAARGRGGANFMNYEPDAAMSEFLADLRLHKRFPTVQTLMHKLHAHIAQTAVIIPLWQLDTYVAVGDRLKARPESHSLFANVEHWTLEPKSK